MNAKSIVDKIASEDNISNIEKKKTSLWKKTLKIFKKKKKNKDNFPANNTSSISVDKAITDQVTSSSIPEEATSDIIEYSYKRKTAPGIAKKIKDLEIRELKITKPNPDNLPKILPLNKSSSFLATNSSCHLAFNNKTSSPKQLQFQSSKTKPLIKQKFISSQKGPGSVQSHSDLSLSKSFSNTGLLSDSGLSNFSRVSLSNKLSSSSQSHETLLRENGFSPILKTAKCGSKSSRFQSPFTAQTFDKNITSTCCDNSLSPLKQRNIISFLSNSDQVFEGSVKPKKGFSSDLKRTSSKNDFKNSPLISDVQSKQNNHNPEQDLSCSNTSELDKLSSFRKQALKTNSPQSLAVSAPLHMQYKKELEAEGETKAHYLVVEVIYHGQSLGAEQKTTIQKEVAKLVDSLLKRKPISPKPNNQNLRPACQSKENKPILAETPEQAKLEENLFQLQNNKHLIKEMRSFNNYDNKNSKLFVEKEMNGNKKSLEDQLNVASMLSDKARAILASVSQQQIKLEEEQKSTQESEIRPAENKSPQLQTPIRQLLLRKSVVATPRNKEPVKQEEPKLASNMVNKETTVERKPPLSKIVTFPKPLSFYLADHNTSNSGLNSSNQPSSSLVTSLQNTRMNQTTPSTLEAPQNTQNGQKFGSMSSPTIKRAAIKRDQIKLTKPSNLISPKPMTAFEEPVHQDKSDPEINISTNVKPSLSKQIEVMAKNSSNTPLCNNLFASDQQHTPFWKNDVGKESRRTQTPKSFHEKNLNSSPKSPRKRKCDNVKVSPIARQGETTSESSQSSRPKFYSARAEFHKPEIYHDAHTQMHFRGFGKTRNLGASGVKFASSHRRAPYPQHSPSARATPFTKINGRPPQYQQQSSVSSFFDRFQSPGCVLSPGNPRDYVSRFVQNLSRLQGDSSDYDKLEPNLNFTESQAMPDYITSTSDMVSNINFDPNRNRGNLFPMHPLSPNSGSSYTTPTMTQRSMSIDDSSTTEFCETTSGQDTIDLDNCSKDSLKYTESSESVSVTLNNTGSYLNNQRHLTPSHGMRSFKTPTRTPEIEESSDDTSEIDVVRSVKNPRKSPSLYHLQRSHENAFHQPEVNPSEKQRSVKISTSTQVRASLSPFCRGNSSSIPHRYHTAGCNTDINATNYAQISREATNTSFNTSTLQSSTNLPQENLVGKRLKHHSKTPEHVAWWMPQEWARERRIGAFGHQWTFQEDEIIDREKELETSRNPNVEKIRTSNFIRF